MEKEKVDNTIMKFGILEDLNNNNRGSMSRRSCFLSAEDYDDGVSTTPQ
jgi:hypothetical protein